VKLYRDEAVVLSTVKLRETDRIITMLSLSHGKIRAVAKGIRGPRSHMTGRAQPFTRLAVQCYRGRDLDTLTQVEVVDSNQRLRADLDRLAAAASIAEVAERVSQEGYEQPDLYRLVTRALAALDRAYSPLLLAGFQLKLLALEGWGPDVTICVECGLDRPLVAIDPDGGGFHCASCRRGDGVSPAGVHLVRLILGGRLNDALAVPASPTTDEVARLAQALLERHLDRPLRSARWSVGVRQST
jgi:DNA repair protein RecO (recombination protein O)